MSEWTIDPPKATGWYWKRVAWEFDNEPRPTFYTCYLTSGTVGVEYWPIPIQEPGESQIKTLQEQLEFVNKYAESQRIRADDNMHLLAAAELSKRTLQEQRAREVEEAYRDAWRTSREQWHGTCTPDPIENWWNASEARRRLESWEPFKSSAQAEKA